MLTFCRSWKNNCAAIRTFTMQTEDIFEEPRRYIFTGHHNNGELANNFGANHGYLQRINFLQLLFGFTPGSSLLNHWMASPFLPSIFAVWWKFKTCHSCCHGWQKQMVLVASDATNSLLMREDCSGYKTQWILSAKSSMQVHFK